MAGCDVLIDSCLPGRTDYEAGFDGEIRIGLRKAGLGCSCDGTGASWEVSLSSRSESLDCSTRLEAKVARLARSKTSAAARTARDWVFKVSFEGVDLAAICTATAGCAIELLATLTDV